MPTAYNESLGGTDGERVSSTGPGAAPDWRAAGHAAALGKCASQAPWTAAIGFARAALPEAAAAKTRGSHIDPMNRTSPGARPDGTSDGSRPKKPDGPAGEVLANPAEARVESMRPAAWAEWTRCSGAESAPIDINPMKPNPDAAVGQFTPQASIPALVTTCRNSRRRRPACRSGRSCGLRRVGCGVGRGDINPMERKHVGPRGRHAPQALFASSAAGLSGVTDADPMQRENG
jgi:hypothetical protein